jgi:cytochrome c553
MSMSRAPVWLALAICLVQPCWAGAATGSTAGAEQVKPLCAACHGVQGVSSIPAIPSLAGQPKVFIENQLVMIREGLREIPAMNGMLNKLSDADLTSLATWYAELKLDGPNGFAAQAPVTPPSSARIAAGATMAKQALCGTCHLATYVGQSQVPRLAGQHEEYLHQTMVLMRDGKAVGRDSIMSSTLRGMSDEQLRDLAYYFSNLRSF